MRCIVGFVEQTMADKVKARHTRIKINHKEKEKRPNITLGVKAKNSFLLQHYPR